MNFTIIITILTIELAALLQGNHAAGFTKEERSEIEIAFSTTAGCRTYPIYRGGGDLPKCPSGQELSGRLCYPKCSQGYYGAGPMCWPNELFYGRTAKTLSLGECNKEEDKSGLLCYAKCKAGFSGTGPVCWNDQIPYARGFGEIPTECTGKGRKIKEAGLCYQECPKNFMGIGEYCWNDACPRDFPIRCGLFCLTTKAQCGVATAKLTIFGIAAAYYLVTSPVDAGSTAITILESINVWNKCA